MRTRRLVYLVAVLAIGATPCVVAGQQFLRAKLSHDEAFLGEVLTVDVIVSNVGAGVVPKPPKTKLFEIKAALGNPISNNRSVSNINGRRTERVEQIHRFRVRPLKTGRLTLPPFEATYKGRLSRTRKFPIKVTKDTSGALVMCKVITDADHMYVGQSLDMRMEVWIRRFRQGTYEMSARVTWFSFREPAASQLGPFAEAAEEPSYREDTRPDDDGVPREYFVFILDGIVRPTKPGRLDFSDLKFAYKYPVKLVRSMFGMQAERSRELVITPEAPALRIKSLPQEGRPADFNGAVGRYRIRAQAKPTEIPVGDPITLTLTIGGEGLLDRLSAPRLDQVDALTRDFEIWGESLAGEIQGNSKRFTQTIRALREDVTEIPPIPMSYFDPEEEAFKTVLSKAIPLVVKSAEKLTLTELSDAGGTVNRLAPLVERTEGLLANYTDPEVVLVDKSVRLGVLEYGVLLAMPCIYLICWIGRNRIVRLRDDTAYRRRSHAYSAARRQLDGGAGVSPGNARNAILCYVADRCNVPAGGLTRADANAMLAERGVRGELIDTTDQLLESLEDAEFGGGTADSEATDGGLELISQAREMLDLMERCKIQ